MDILIVEDDRIIAENLYDFLESCGHQCDFATSLAGARILLASRAIDVLILDRNLPDGDGATLAKELRDSGKMLPILMLTARDALEDKLAGFDAGADDYLAKPFALKEVEVRLKALHRRSLSSLSQHENSSDFGPFCYDPNGHTLAINGRQLALPPKALRLLLTLLPQPGRLFTRRELEVAIWGEAQASSDNLRSVLHTLRKAFAEVGPIEPAIEICNVHGQGYRLVQS